MRQSRLFLIGSMVLAVVALNVAVWAEGETAPAWPKKPPFSVRLGSYFSDTASSVRIDGANGQGTVIDVHNLLKVPNTATAFRALADVRVASWFGLEAEYYRVSRGKSTTIDRDITVGDTVFPINETVTTSYIQSYLDVSLKFYLFHRQRWDLGLWLGANSHFYKLSLNAEPSGLSEVRNPWYPVPALGVVFNWSPLPRLYLYGKVGYFYYKLTDPNTKLDTTRFDITLDYYFWKVFGVGVTYANEDSSVELTKASYTGVINNRISGIQIYGVIGF